MLFKAGFGGLFLYQLFLMFLNANADEINGMQSKKSCSSSSSFRDTDHIYLYPSDLKIGKQMPIYFGGVYSSQKFPHFLPKERADVMPFSSQDLPFLLQVFGFAPGSSQARDIEYTLRMCEMKMHEVKFCATSLESMLDFVHETFSGIDHYSLKVLSTSPLPKSTKLLQNYTFVKQPLQVPSPKMVACHMLVYPYAVFHCHYPDPENRVFEIFLRGEDGALVDAVANCHMNTTTWDPNHASFRVLGLKPGSPICHFITPYDLVWVPAVVDPRKNQNNKIIPM